MVELKMDTAALNALFPEGTEARVALQQAVINNITKNLLSKHLNQDIKDQVAEAAKALGLQYNFQELVQKELGTYLDRRGWASTYPLQESRKEELAKSIRQQVSTVASSEFHALSKKITGEAVENFNNGVERKIAYALENVQGLATARLNTGWNEIMDKAIADRLGLQVKS
ncbi:hypothetical protein pEaSNUABM55_00247 [Erwinia phage pEa_SNUABM_55]|nr:hypothetical protein pEaSNUABM55_00247 [Erwinia phage pEa_SNUABM_55]